MNGSPGSWGLGNAGLAEDAAAVTIYAADPSDEVRAAVASGLRRMPSESAVATLLRLVTDPSGAVARAAIASLFRHALTDSAWGTLNDAIAADRIGDAARAVLVNELARRLGDDSHVETALRLLHDARSTDPQLRIRIESLVAW